MSLRYLLDTNIVSQSMKRHPNVEVMRRLALHEGECAIATPVWHELVYGCQRLPAGRRRETLEESLHRIVAATFPMLAYDADASYWHARERARLDALGKTAPFIDGQIAAIAHANDLILVTADVKDFSRFPDLEIENWTKRRA